MRQALELALEALERSVATCFDQRSHDEVMGRPEHFVNKAITALRLAIDVQNMASESTYKEALAQEQEPVAYLSNKRQRINIEIKPQTFVEIPTVTDWEMPLYMKPPQRTWVGLTDEEMAEIIDAEIGFNSCWGPEEAFARAIEAKLKEKNNG
jgi:hypothetical protein